MVEMKNCESFAHLSDAGTNHGEFHPERYFPLIDQRVRVEEKTARGSVCFHPAIITGVADFCFILRTQISATDRPESRIRKLNEVLGTLHVTLEEFCHRMSFPNEYGNRPLDPTY